MYLAVSLVFFAIIALIWFISSKNRLAVEHRFLHIRLVFVAIITAIASTLFFANILQLLNVFLTRPKIQNLLFHIMPISNTSASFFWIVMLLSCLFVSIIYLIINTAIFVGVLVPLSKRNYLKSNAPLDKFFNSISFKFFNDNGTITLEAFNIGKWVRRFKYILAAFLFVLTLGVSIYLNFNFTILDDVITGKILKSLYMLPVVSFFILDQVEIYLMGDVKVPKSDIQTEEVRMHQIGDFKILVNLFLKYFGGEALIATYKPDDKLSNSLFSAADNEQKERLNNKQELFEAVCNSINNAVQPLQPHYREAVLDLVDGNSIAFCETYNGEFVVYLLAYIQQNLYKGRKALIVCDTDAQVEKLIKQYEDIFKRINKLNKIWNISNEDKLDKSTDILICTEETLLNRNVQFIHSDFFSRIHDIVVLDTYGILCRNNSYVIRFFEFLKEYGKQFAFFIPENNLDIKNTLKLYLECQDINIYENHNINYNPYILCWRGESSYKTQRVISNNLYDDFGIAYTIALIACKYDISKVNIYASDNIPLETYANIARNNAKLIATSIFARDNVVFDSIIRHNEIAAFQKKALSFDIYYDDNNNLLNVAKLAISNCANVASMVNIVSKPYMLRDYFAAKLSDFSDSESGTQCLVPSFYGNDINSICISLLIKMREQNMTCENIVEFMNSHGVKGDNVEKLLYMALKKLYNGTPVGNVYDYFSFGGEDKVDFKDNNYLYTREVKLINEDVYNSACSMTENYLRISGDYSDILPIDKDAVYNRFLTDQIHNFGGKRYIISSINNNTVTVRSEETVEYEPLYTNLYGFNSIKFETVKKNAYNNNNIICDLLEGDVKRVISGYFTHFDGLNFNTYEDENFTVFNRLSENITESKRIKALRLNISFPFGKDYEKAAALLLVLLRGAFETLFPKNYKDISIVSLIDKKVYDDVDFVETSEDVTHLRKDPVPSDWIEADDYYVSPSKFLLEYILPSIENCNLIGNSEESINIYFLNYLNADNGITDTICRDIERIFEVIYHYFRWYLANPTDKHAYLKFGYNHIPELFDVASVNGFLELVTKRADKPEKAMDNSFEVTGDTNIDYCSFCGRPITVSGREFDDNRKMCEDCYKFITTARYEVNELLADARRIIEETYSVTFNDKYSVKFMSAKSIRKRCGTVVDGRILGFCNYDKKEIWIERGGPKACMLSTLIHELTHAWQFENLPDYILEQTFLLEGHAVYTEIECIEKQGHTVYAKFLEDNILSMNDDVYAKGYRYWKDVMKSASDKNIFHNILEL